MAFDLQVRYLELPEKKGRVAGGVKGILGNIYSLARDVSAYWASPIGLITY